MEEIYIIQTPVKDEESNLPRLIESVVNQTICPKIWLIIDDGSTDSTPEIINEAKDNYDWIESINLEKGEYDLGLHLSDVINTGISTLLKICKEREISYSYWGNVDADVFLVEDYYELLIKEFEKDSSLGVASGGTWYYKNEVIHYYKASEDEPSGGNMLLRKECFEDCISPLQLTYSWDSVMKTKAKIKKWKTKRFDSIKSIDSRDVNAVAGYWKGYFKTGIGLSYLNFHPIHVVVKSVSRFKRPPYYLGVAFLCGYLYNTLILKQKISDKDVKKYNWNRWKLRLKQTHKNHLSE